MIESTPAFNLPAAPDAGQPGHLDAHQKTNAVLETLTAFVNDVLVPALNQLETTHNDLIMNLVQAVHSGDAATLAAAKAYTDQLLGPGTT